MAAPSFQAPRVKNMEIAQCFLLPSVSWFSVYPESCTPNPYPKSNNTSPGPPLQPWAEQAFLSLRFVQRLPGFPTSPAPHPFQSSSQESVNT